MQALVLGPLTMCVGDKPLHLGTPKQKATLALLVIRANTVVSVDDVIAELWGDRPPASALANTRMYAANLRRTLSAAADAPELTRRGAGYQLTIDPARVDAGCFRNLLRQAHDDLGRGDHVGAVSRFDRALQMWRGDALADVPVGPALRGWCVAVEEERLRAVEDRAETHLALGVVDRPAADLHELLVRAPLRERAVALLMRARYQAGDVDGALATFDQARRKLIEQLGLEPGEELRRLQHAVLNRDPVLAGPDGLIAVSTAGPATVPRQLPVDVAGFVGRVDHLRQLDELLSADLDSETATVAVAAITGTAGVGKTALAVRWAHRVADRFPDGQLYVDLRGFHPNATVLGPDEVVRNFLDALGVPTEQIPDGLIAQAALYRSRMSGRRMLVVLDNARDADHVRPLLPGSSGCLVVVTSRNRLTGLVAVEGARAVTLALPTVAEAHQLLARRLGAQRVAAEPQAVQQIIDACARLPIALVIAAAHAAAHVDFPLAALADELHDARGGLQTLHGGDSTSDVRALFSWSYRALSAPAARLFRLLGLHPGADIARPAVASLAGVPVDQVRPVLAELIRQHLLTEHVPGRYGFHDLLGAYAIEQSRVNETESQRREALLRLLDHYLHTAWRAARLLNPHRDPLAPPVAAAGVVPEEHADRDAALAWFTAEHPILLAAVREAGRSRFDLHAWHLARTLTTFFLRRGYWHHLIASQEVAVTAAARLADPVKQAHAHNDLGIGCARLGRFVEVHTRFGEALELYAQADDQIGQAKVHGNLAEAFEQQGRYREALGHALQALDIYLATGRRERQGHALNMAGWCHARLGEFEQALTFCGQALEFFGHEGDRYGQAHAWDSLGYVYHQLGRHSRAKQCYGKAVELFQDSGDRFYEADSLVKLGDIHQAAGDPAGARAAWRAALAILDDLEHPNADAVRARFLAPCHGELGIRR